MEKIIAGRHLTLKPENKAYIHDELSQIETKYLKLTSARVVLDQQKHNYIAEISLHGKNLVIDATAKATDLEPAFDMALRKAERQLTKFLSKIQDHHNVSLSELEQTATEEAFAELELEELEELNA